MYRMSRPQKHAWVDQEEDDLDAEQQIQNFDTKNRSRYQKGDLGHLDAS